MAETLNLADLEGYSTGGTIHVVINNQIGFTTLPKDARSSTYCTDVAKMVQAPVFHVNGDDPEAVVHVAALAFEYRQRFKRDVVIDMVGYRRWGHNEGDEPRYTQPLMYAKIKSHTSVAQLYGEQLVRTGAVTARGARRRSGPRRRPPMQREGGNGAFAAIARAHALQTPPAGGRAAMWGRLKRHAEGARRGAGGLRAAPEARARSSRRRADLLEGKGDVRLGHRRGARLRARCCSRAAPCACRARTPAAAPSASATPSLYDVRTGKEYVPLQSVASGGARFEVHDSLLSEAAVMGFEFGYAVADHRVARHVGGAVRRLLQRRADHRRPVPGRLRDRSGASRRASSCCCRTGTKARARSTRARASSAS